MLCFVQSNVTVRGESNAAWRELLTRTLHDIIKCTVAISISTNGPGIGRSTSVLISKVSSELGAAGVVVPRMRGGMLSSLLVPRLEPIITFITGWLLLHVEGIGCSQRQIVEAVKNGSFFREDHHQREHSHPLFFGFKACI